MDAEAREWRIPANAWRAEWRIASRCQMRRFTGSGRRSPDWCADTGTSREVAEAALAHTVGGVEGAYFRSQPATVVERARPVQDVHRPGGQGNPMGRSGLRPLAGDAPLASLSIHLAPKRPAGFSRPYRCQDQEPEAETGRNARLRPVHGFKRRRYFRVWRRPEVRLDGQHGRQRALDSFPGHVLFDVAMRPTPSQHGALSPAGGGNRSRHPGL